MKRDQWIIAVGTVVLVGALVGLFFFFYERVEQQVDRGPQAAARFNPFLAAERVLSGMGLPVESVRGPVGLPPTDHVMLLVTPRSVIGEERSIEILAWAERGGHLIVAPRASWDFVDLLDADRARRQAEAETAETGADPETGDDGAEALILEAEDQEATEDKEEVKDPLLDQLTLHLVETGDISAGVISVRPGRDAPPHEIEVVRALLLESESDPYFHDGPGDGAVVLRFSHGDGWITVLSDVSFLRNEQLGDHEHASFLWSLVTSPVPPAGVWLVYRDRLPTLGELLLGRAWTALVSLAVLLLAWLWARGVRFGPPVVPASPERRSLREHLEATAEFLWRQGRTAALVRSERQAVLHAVSRQHPTWEDLPVKERMQFLSELSGIAGGKLYEALEGSVKVEPNELTRMIITLEKVRRSL